VSGGQRGRFARLISERRSMRPELSWAAAQLHRSASRGHPDASAQDFKLKPTDFYP